MTTTAPVTEATAPTAELRFRAMGTDCHVIVTAADPAPLLELARDRVELLEQSWSRFRPTSALSFLNAFAGCGPTPASDDLILLVQRMREGWLMTDGLFDPTVLASVTGHGYDADFASVVARPASSLLDVRLAAAPGMSAVTIDHHARTITLPSGIGLDPGAIGKGLAADVIAGELHASGADGVLVNLGGDIAVSGESELGTWTIAVDDERRTPDAIDRVLAVVELDTEHAGVATSTTLKRRWAQGRRHHVIDPRSGQCSASGLVQVTVVAPTACEAEVLATAALLKEPQEAAQWLADRGVTAHLLTDSHALTIIEGKHHG